MSDNRYKKFTTGHMMRDMHFSGAALKVGEPFPNFELPTTAGGTHEYNRDSGRPLLVVTGSITCPMTASAMPVLRGLHAQFGDKVDFVTLYTREAHPGENFPQPATLEEKSAHAAAMKREYDVPWTMVVDSLDGKLHKALDAKPNDAYLVNDHGIIVFRSLWSSDEKALGAALSDLISGKKQRRSQSTAFMGPVMTAVGHVTDTMKLAGPQATRDLIRSAPPMYMMGWISDLFRSGKRKADIPSA